MLRLTIEREGRGWSKSELARRARLQPGEVGKIENRRVVPYPSQLRKLARALGIPRDQAASLVEDQAPTLREPALA